MTDKPPTRAQRKRRRRAARNAHGDSLHDQRIYHVVGPRFERASAALERAHAIRMRRKEKADEGTCQLCRPKCIGVCVTHAVIVWSRAHQRFDSAKLVLERAMKA